MRFHVVETVARFAHIQENMSNNRKRNGGEMTGGYRACACRDCFDIAIGGRHALCHACEAAGCEADSGECCRDDAYGVGDESECNCGTPGLVQCDMHGPRE